MTGKRVYIYCEGQTEETFVKRILSSYLAGVGIYAYPVAAATKRTARKKFKGGVTTYDRIKHQLEMLCKQYESELVTTMIDYYALPPETPELSDSVGDANVKARRVEEAIKKDIGEPNLFVHLQIHEFEALLFSDPRAFEILVEDGEGMERVEKMVRIRADFSTPEDINNAYETAPSKRIAHVFPTYKKVTDGLSVAELVGIDAMLLECPHFAEWVRLLIRLAR